MSELPSSPFTAYSQYSEDLVLAALLDDVEVGFYVDVGANHEEYHSVTKYFYERDWNGINVEPTPALFDALVAGRPRDINLNVALSDTAGSMIFREYPQHDGLSTLSPRPEHEHLPHRDYEVEVATLATILCRYGVGRIDFLKIDVEGFEAEVLRGNDWSQFRPRVVCAEANAPGAGAWQDYLAQQGYAEFIFDGLNRFYIANEASALVSGFAERAAVYAHYAIREHHQRALVAASERAAQLEAVTLSQERLIEQLRQTLADAGRMISRLQEQQAGG